MKIDHISTVYFSPTRTTKKIVNEISVHIADRLGIERDEISITTPKDRKDSLKFKARELVIIGVPVYAGRVPNLLVPYLKNLEGNGAICVPIVVFGNRSFGDALYEHRDIMENDGFHCIAAGAFVAEHSFSSEIATGRPDLQDMQICSTFSNTILEKIKNTANIEDIMPLDIPGKSETERKYFVPKNPRNGKKLNFIKIKPETSETCTDCGICARICPTGAINPKNPRKIIGPCIKCNACVKFCPSHSKSFLEQDYIIHVQDIINTCNSLGYSKPKYFV
ncbi:MAG: EFR1 family ferrodoxin [Bacteroidales bacterium]